MTIRFRLCPVVSENVLLCLIRWNGRTPKHSAPKQCTRLSIINKSAELETGSLIGRVDIQDAKLEIEELETDMAEIEEHRVDLASYFCEDQDGFRLEECFKIVHTFSEKFVKAIEVNDLARLGGIIWLRIPAWPL